MLNPTKYDFSQESNLRGRLFKSLKKEYEKVRSQMALSDDDLEIVVAAGEADGVECPIPGQTCEQCDKFKLGICTAGYTRNGG